MLTGEYSIIITNRICFKAFTLKNCTFHRLSMPEIICGLKIVLHFDELFLKWNNTLR